MINTNYLQKKVLIDCLEFLGRGQSPSYIEEESEILAINQKCVRNSTVDVSSARAHNSRVIVKDNAILQNGDICINSTGTGTIGRIGLWSSESQISNNQYFADSHVTVARPDKTKINPKYLSALLESEKIQTSLETYCFSGSTNQIELNKAALSELNIEIIPIEAQHIVADILSTIDRAITQTEAIITKQQRIKTGLMQDLLTKGIDENGNIRSEATHEFKDSSIGRIPVEWEVCKLGEKARIRSGSTPSRANQKYWNEGEISWVRTSEVNFSEITSTEEKITELALRLCALHMEPIGTVIVAMYGQGKTRGRCAILNIEATTNQACGTILGKGGEVHQKYLFHYLSSQYDELRNVGHGSNQTNLNGKLLSLFLIKLPEYGEQVKIANFLNQIDTQINQAQINLAKLELTKTGLMQDLLTGKVRVTPLLEKEPASP